MKVVFAGPSLYKASFDRADIVFRPPVVHGDIARAVLDGARIVGLIDGFFSTTATVWHKEILFALSQNVQVLGAASMGALRAAECAMFGMEPVGEIALRYLSGDLDDDAAVALVHGPAECGFAPLTEALVDAEATIAAMQKSGCLEVWEVEALLNAARSIYFKERTPAVIIETAFPKVPQQQDRLAALYRQFRVSLKQQDALQLVKAVADRGDTRTVSIRHWCLSEPPVWRQILAEIRDRGEVGSAA